MNFHKEFLDFLPIGAYRTRPDGTVEYANHALAEMLGYPTVEKLLEENSEHFYVDLNERERWRREIEASPNGKVLCFTTQWRQLNRVKTIRVKNSARVIRENGIVIGYEGVVIDVGNLPRHPEPLPVPDGVTDTQLWSDEVKNTLPICISRKSLNRKVEWANSAFLRVEGISMEELKTQKNTDALIYGKDLDAIYRDSDQVVFETRKPHIAIEPHGSGDQKRRMVQVVKIPVFNEQGQIVGIESMFWDLAELDEAKSQTQKIENLLQSQYNVIYEHDLNDVITKVNRAAEDLTGRKASEWIGKPFSSFVAPEYKEFVVARTREKLNATNPADAVTTYEIDLLDSEDWRIPVEVTSRLLIRDGKPIGVIGYLRDLTNRKEAEQSRLREIHHRVKNSLNTIYALLGNEQDRADSKQTQDAIEACRMRVLTIAELHKQLYKAPRVDRMDVGKYVRDLIEQLIRIYRQPWQEISPRIATEASTHLSLDTLTPFALILHELVSNVMKHAFPKKDDGGKRHGILFVTFARRVGNGVYTLRVEDTGIGLPPGFDLKKSRQLGMRLVLGLAETQLRGTIQHASSSSGSSFVLEFSDTV